VEQRTFGVLLIAAAAALWIGSYAQYNMGEDDRTAQRTVAVLRCEALPCPEPSFDYTMNWVAAGVGAVLFSTGVLVAATGGTRTVRLEGREPAGAAPPPKNESVVSALVELDSLHESGLVSDDEYAAKRTEILGRL